ncbi:signal peptidase I [Streptomyces sp. NPDC001787]|uniref:signal peptidase I n=1 Tax=Streptomyces sp. NPDC001787 TaxID=3154523 RepID=UPI0033206634
MNSGVYAGNAGNDAHDDPWILGHFKTPGDLRHSHDVEVKWGIHPRGDERTAWVTGEERTGFLILISGRFRMHFPTHSVLLAQQGDYVTWGRGIDHSWTAEADSVVMTVRWPSIPGYKAPKSP